MSDPDFARQSPPSDTRELGVSEARVTKAAPPRVIQMNEVFETAAVFCRPASLKRLPERFSAMFGGHAAAPRSYETVTESGIVVAAGPDSGALKHQQQYAEQGAAQSLLNMVRFGAAVTRRSRGSKCASGAVS
jgi:hypothetical protein